MKQDSPSSTFSFPLSSNSWIVAIAYDELNQTKESNIINVEVKDEVLANLSVSKTEIVEWDNVTFNLSISGGFPGYTIKWWINGSEDASLLNKTSFTKMISSNTTVRAQVYDSYSYYSKLSNSVSVNVFTGLCVEVIAPDQANVTGGKQPYNYTWHPVVVDVIYIGDHPIEVYSNNRVTVTDALGQTLTDELGGTGVCIRKPVPMLNNSSEEEFIVWKGDDENVEEYETKLGDNFPNPFNPSTNIQYSLNSESKVSIKVYNILGEEVAVLVDEFKPKGKHSCKFEAGNLPSGIYIYRIQTDDFTDVKKMMLVK